MSRSLYPLIGAVVVSMVGGWLLRGCTLRQIPDGQGGSRIGFVEADPYSPKAKKISEGILKQANERGIPIGWRNALNVADNPAAEVDWDIVRSLVKSEVTEELDSAWSHFFDRTVTVEELDRALESYPWEPIETALNYDVPYPSRSDRFDGNARMSMNASSMSKVVACHVARSVLAGDKEAARHRLIYLWKVMEFKVMAEAIDACSNQIWISEFKVFGSELGLLWLTRDVQWFLDMVIENCPDFESGACIRVRKAMASHWLGMCILGRLGGISDDDNAKQYIGIYERLVAGLPIDEGKDLLPAYNDFITQYPKALAMAGGAIKGTAEYFSTTKIGDKEDFRATTSRPMVLNDPNIVRLATLPIGYLELSECWLVVNAGMPEWRSYTDNYYRNQITIVAK